MIDLEEIKLLCKRIIDWELTPVDSGTAHQLAHKTIDLISEASRLCTELSLESARLNAADEQIKKLQELVRVQKEYITYLEEIYGMRTSRRATELRSQIKELEKEI